MRRTLCLMGALIAVGVAGATQNARTQEPASAPAAVAPVATTANVATPTLTAAEQQVLAGRFTPERLAAIRARLAGAHTQRAVRDHAEQAFREPTAAEAAILAAGTSGDAEATVLALSGSGVALKTDVNSLEFATASVDEHGAVVTHEGKGVRRDR